jgi:predicted dehydrogenase/threonine dehydrogenase-like Zn-dependent dehydrogenase
MKQVLLSANGGILIEDVPSPGLKGEGVVIRTLFSVISPGTESAIIRGASENLFRRLARERKLAKAVWARLRWNYIRRAAQAKGLPERAEQPHAILGYSSVGVVTQSSCSISVGEKVACMGAPHAEMAYVPKHLCAKVPGEVPLREAAFGAIGCIALHSTRKARISAGEIIVVVGLGTVGQLAVMFSKQAGAIVIGVDLHEGRLSLAGKSGADHVVNPKWQDPATEIRYLTKGCGADAVLLCASSQSADLLRQAMLFCRDRGRVVVTGDVPLTFPRNEFYHKELDLTISRSYGPGRYDPHYEEEGFDYPRQYVRWTEERNLHGFISLLQEKKISLRHLISDEVALENIQEAYGRIQNSAEDTLTMMVGYSGNVNEKKAPQMTKIKSRKNAALQIGVIGCGAFARQFRLPHLGKSPLFRIVAVADSNPVLAKGIGGRYHAEYCTADYREVLENKRIDTILVSTRHNLHAGIAIEALEHGKHVFVEKPAAMNMRECRALYRAAQKNRNCSYGIGFNRRFSVLSGEMKSRLSRIDRPKTINYRVASLPVLKSHWICDPLEGGGRILGEAVHFLDLIRWFAGCEPTSIAAHGGTRNSPPQGFSDENYVITVHFQDGSIGNIFHSDQSSEYFPKERIEVFAGGLVMVIDNFESLSMYSNGGLRTIQKKDKGFDAEMNMFGKAILAGSVPQPGIRDGIIATVLALNAQDSIRDRRTVSVDTSFLVDSAKK